MASDLSLVEFIADQLRSIGSITYKKMFGEYAIYCEEKVVGFVCDNQFFVKSTPGGRTFVGNITEAPPYPGAKLHFLIEDKIEDNDWMCNLIGITAMELPTPKPKKRRAEKNRNETA
jgi:TfoX/Sxy family transcriptional regulator of competence genes